MTVRAKLKCVAKTETVVKFETQYDPTIPEDQKFTKATPWGNASFGIDNPVALSQFEQGRDYYVDFTPAQEPQQQEQAVSEPDLEGLAQP